MPYDPKIVEEVKRLFPNCFICGIPFEDNEFSAVHSGTGYHFVLVPSDDPGEKYRYKTTCPPDGHPEMMGVTFAIGEFKQFGFRYFADAVRVHHHCHKRIHALALQLCKENIPGFKGNGVTAHLLAEATFNFKFYRKVK